MTTFYPTSQKIANTSQKQRVLNARIRDSIFLFDMTDGCKFFTSRTKSDELLNASSVYDIMSESEAAQMILHLLSYSNTPMAVNTKHGIAIVLPFITPASSFGILSFPEIGGAEFCRAAKAHKLDFILSKDVKALRLHVASNDSDTVQECLALYSQYLSALGMRAAPAPVCSDMGADLAERIYDIAEYVGCPTSVYFQNALINVGDFDFPLFVAFLLTFLISARKHSPLREASVFIEANGLDNFVRISFETDGQEKHMIDGFSTFKRLCARKNLFCECIHDENIFHIKLLPCSKDWSLLGIKSPLDDEENWDLFGK